MLHKIISGGQTGADYGALRGARAAGLLTGGYIGKGWRTETGPAPWLAAYNLIELESQSYQTRTLKNVANSDGTLLIAPKLESPGSRYTLRVAKNFNKPRLVITGLTEAIPDIAWEITNWLEENSIRTLNVAGNRESVSPGIEKWTERLVREIAGDCDLRQEERSRVRMLA
jgi:hypothetical protein